MEIRIPKPAYLRSRLVRREAPDADIYAILVHLAQTYRLGEILQCYRAKPSNSLNYVVVTKGTCSADRSPTQTKYIFRRHLLSEETVAHEYEVLEALRKRAFPAPRMLQDQEGRAWVNIQDRIFSIYAFVEGYRPIDFFWWPAHQRIILHQTGQALARLHQALTGFEPTRFKWDAYRPGTSGPRRPRWRDGALYRDALAQIRSLVAARSATQPVDRFVESHIDGLEQLIAIGDQVESCSELCQVVIHGDYAPWNILRRADSSLFILDFNAARLDLRMYDVILATFWFAWHKDHLDTDTAIALQAGYLDGLRKPGKMQDSSSPIGPVSLPEMLPLPSESEIAMAHDVFRWLMGRSIVERLRSHYLENRFLLTNTQDLERFYQMCIWAGQHPEQLTLGLRRSQSEE